MCLILLAYRVHPRYPLVLAANRDELYRRPTAPASFWPEAPDLLAGRDLLQGGTWLGVTRGGRLAALTNLGDARPFRGDAPSRGGLVTGFLLSGESPERYLERLDAAAAAYNGFNLVVGGLSGLYCYCNSGGETDGAAVIPPGITGLSNHPPQSPWQKTVRGETLLAQALSGRCSEEDLFAVLADSRAPGLPGAEQGQEVETARSPIFIRTPSFGTRCSTVLMADAQGSVTFSERTYDRGNEGTVRFRFAVPAR